jgi:copper resistance protein B
VLLVSASILYKRAPTSKPEKTLMYRPAFLLAFLLACPSAPADQQPQEDAVSGNADSSDWHYRVRVGKLERQFSTRDDGEFAEWAAIARIGKGGNNLWFTTKGATRDGDTDSAEVRLFYGRTIRPHIDIHLGWKRDLKPQPERDWLGFGVLGVLPYKIGADVSVFIGEAGRMAARLEMAYTHWITKKLSLTPDLEANFYSEDDPERGIGSGFSDLDLGLRMRYRVVNSVSPYAGVTLKANFDETGDMIESEGGEPMDLRFVVGVTLRF